MTVKNPDNRTNKNSIQQMQEMSFDPEFEVLGRELLTYNPVAETLERVSDIQGNASYVLDYLNGNLSTVTKTVGATSYTKTLSYTDGSLTGVSSWS